MESLDSAGLDLKKERYVETGNKNTWDKEKIKARCYTDMRVLITFRNRSKHHNYKTGMSDGLSQQHPARCGLSETPSKGNDTKT